ncbi:MAG: hypothetical protein Fur0012_11740 [Elusimicrobiota bacterium]
MATNLKDRLKKLFLLLLSFAALGLVLRFFLWFSSSQEEAEIIRKLSSIRLCLTLYSINEKKVSTDPVSDLARVGYMKEIPYIKLKWKLKSDKIELVDTVRIRDTGHWAYVNNPSDIHFGLLYIDSSARDSKERYWSWL